MPDILRQEPFTQDKVSEVVGFYCGDSPWAIAQAQWITEGLALRSIEERGNDVWLYYNSQNNLVGFGSLGETRRKFPPPDGEYLQLSIIPSLAIQSNYHGLPKEKPKYSYQIMGDLIAKARDRKPNLLTLDVHVENDKAIALYRKYEFFDTGYIRNDQLKMFLRIR